MEYMEFTPVSAIPFLIAYTRATIKECAKDPRLAAAGLLSVDKRGDVDDYDRYPLVIVDATVAQPVKNQPQYGMGLEMRGRWLFMDHNSDRCEEAASQFARGLVRSWRNRLETPEGWASWLDIESGPLFSGQMVTTADITEFTILGRVIARRRH